MFEMYDSFHDYFMAGEVQGTPITPNYNSVNPQCSMHNVTAGTLPDQQANPFPWKDLIITAGSIAALYLLVDALIDKNDHFPNYFERREIARQRASRQD